MPPSSEFRSAEQMLALVVERATARRAERRRRRALAGGAVVLVLLAGVAGVALTRVLADDPGQAVHTAADDGDQEVGIEVDDVQGGPEVEVSGLPEGPVEDASGIWGRTWRVTRIVEDGDERAVAADEEGTPIVLDLGVEGTITSKVCNEFWLVLLVEDGRLRSIERGQNLAGCAGIAGQQEDLVRRIFRAGPTIELRGGELVLRGDGLVTVLADATAEQPPQAIAARVLDPDAFSLRTWRLIDIVGSSLPIDAQGRVDLHGRLVTELDVPEPGVLRYVGCREIAGPYRFEEDRLVWEPGAWSEPTQRCAAQPESLGTATLEDEYLVAALSSRPRMVIRGWLYVVAGDRVVTFNSPEGR